MLRSKGLDFTEKDGAVQFIMRCGGHKWNAAFVADEQGFLRYYARYPFRISESSSDRALGELNRLNEGLRAGCFMISGGYPVFRYGVYIFDDFTAAESVADLFVTAAARTDAAWGEIYGAVYGAAGSEES
jgi:hypothetical protein